MAYTEFHEPHPICWSILDVVCMEPSISLVHAAAPPHSYRRLPEPCSRFLEATSISESSLEEFALARTDTAAVRSEEHTSELQSHLNLVCRLLLEKKKIKTNRPTRT